MTDNLKLIGIAILALAIASLSNSYQINKLKILTNDLIQCNSQPQSQK